MDKKAIQESVIAFYQKDELVAVAQKNGHTKFYRVEAMGAEEICDLFDAKETI